tara:strand:- start:312 stop:845 length:534 start_codon:yes stop_codon:yes gene_type:complete
MPRKYTLSEEQRAAVAERFRVAREKKRAVDPSYGKKSIHPKLRDLPEHHHLHPDKVKEWIKVQRKILTGAKASTGRASEALARETKDYIDNLHYYLRTGQWDPICFGEYGERPVIFIRDGVVRWSYLGPAVECLGEDWESKVRDIESGLRQLALDSKPRGLIYKTKEGHWSWKGLRK